MKPAGHLADPLVARAPAPRRRCLRALAGALGMVLCVAAGCGGGDGTGRDGTAGAGSAGGASAASRSAAPHRAAQRQDGDPGAGATGPAAAPPTGTSPPAMAPSASGGGPRVALVIDDLGQRLGGPAAVILSLPVPLTLAVLPGLPHSRDYAEMAGPGALAPAPADSAAAFRAVPPRELFLHLPMQPLDYPASDPGPGALVPGQEQVEVEARLEAALASVPGARGVNNHMGSAATADRALMDLLMGALRARGLRFLDSLTSAQSTAWQAARDAGVPTARNRIFLDADPGDEAAIAANLAELVRVARDSGRAIGIAHPHVATAAVLAREIPRYQAEGVRFVTVSELMTPAAAAVVAAETTDAR